jgi:threonine dehydratase
MSEITVSFRDIQAAAKRLQSVAVRTPLLYSQDLDARCQARVFYKPESLQHIGAFKFRGAYNRLAQLNSEELGLGVVAYSSGNHAQGVAYAAKLLNCPVTIVMPSDAPRIKLENTRKLGAKVQLYDRHTESREEIAAAIANETGATLVPAFDDPDIIAGQGTCGLELMEQLADYQLQASSLLSPVGGGGLLAGLSLAAKAMDPAIKVYAVEPENYDDHFRSRAAGERVRIDGTVKTRCDSLMATTPGELTWSINSQLVEDFLLVTEDEVAHAISYAFYKLKLVIEPGGAVALAALLQGRLPVQNAVVALVLSGGNIDADTFASCLQQFPNP